MTSSAKAASSKPTSSLKQKPVKFIPNIIQLQEALKDLPDPKLHDQDRYTCPVLVDGKNHSLEFVRKRITRGSTRPFRWIYAGKVLIRNQDIPK
jgi:hypothetical protein